MNEMTPPEGMSIANCAGKIQNICKEAYTNHGWITIGKDDIDTLVYAAAVMRKFATGELVEVVHARWVIDEFGHKCKNCEEYAVINSGRNEELTSYCPNCGALMGKDDNNAK